jgi:hypothetical protein
MLLRAVGHGIRGRGEGVTGDINPGLRVPGTVQRNSKSAWKLSWAFEFQQPAMRHTERVPRVVQAAAVAGHEANRVLKVLVQESSDASQQRDASPRIHEDCRARQSEPTRADSAGFLFVEHHDGVGRTAGRIDSLVGIRQEFSIIWDNLIRRKDDLPGVLQRSYCSVLVQSFQRNRIRSIQQRSSDTWYGVVLAIDFRDKGIRDTAAVSINALESDLYSIRSRDGRSRQELR